MALDKAEARMQLITIEEALADPSGNNVQINGLANFVAKLQQLLCSMGLTELANWVESKTNAEALQVISKARSDLASESLRITGEVPAFARNEAKTNATANNDVVGNESGGRKIPHDKPVISVGNLPRNAVGIVNPKVQVWQPCPLTAMRRNTAIVA